MSRKSYVRDLGGTPRKRDLVESPAQTADIGDSQVTTAKIADDAVTNAKLANMAEATFKLRAAGAGTGDPIDGTAAQARAAAGLSYGLQTIWVPAAGMNEYVGASAGRATYIASAFSAGSFDFDQTTLEVATFIITMPKSWDKGNIFFVPYWTATSGSGTVLWTFFAVAFSDNDGIPPSFSTAVTSTDTFLGANKLHVGPITSGLTPDASPANDDMIWLAINRDPSGDTLNADAVLLGVKILYNINAGNDS